MISLKELDRNRRKISQPGFELGSLISVFVMLKVGTFTFLLIYAYHARFDTRVARVLYQYLSVVNFSLWSGKHNIYESTCESLC